MIYAGNMPEEDAERAEALLFDCRPDMREARQCFKRYLFYEPEGRNRRKYTCPECGRFFMNRGETDLYSEDSFRYKHGDTGTCPYCGCEVIFVAKGRIRSGESLRECKQFLFLFEREGMLLMKAGTVEMDYYDDLCPEPVFYPRKCYAFTKTKRMAWKWDDGWRYGQKQKKPTWERMKTVSEPFPAAINYYETRWYHVGGLENVARTEVRFSALEDWLNSFYTLRGMEITDQSTDIIRYLCAWQRRPPIEMLVKLGHTDLIKGILAGDGLTGYDWKAKSPQGFFRMSKAEYKVFRDNAGKHRELEIYRGAYSDIPMEEYFRVLRLMDKQGAAWFFGLFRSDPRRKKLERWLEGQREEWRLWKDTLEMEAKLGNDITHDDVLMPEKLRARHDKCTEIIHELKIRNRADYTILVLPKLRERYEFRMGGLMIRIPENGDEITAEGKLLRHCVAGYAERHLDGIKTILFLRWEDDPETPYMTIEVDGDKVQQIHGYRNDIIPGECKPMEIHGEFINAWLAWVKAGSKRKKNGAARVRVG